MRGSRRAAISSRQGRSSGSNGGSGRRTSSMRMLSGAEPSAWWRSAPSAVRGTQSSLGTMGAMFVAGLAAGLPDRCGVAPAAYVVVRVEYESRAHGRASRGQVRGYLSSRSSPKVTSSSAARASASWSVWAWSMATCLSEARPRSWERSLPRRSRPRYCPPSNSLSRRSQSSIRAPLRSAPVKAVSAQRALGEDHGAGGSDAGEGAVVDLAVLE